MKYLTVELAFKDEDLDIHDRKAQQGVLDGVKTMEAVQAARVVGTGEGPDPEADSLAAPDDVATVHDPETNAPVPAPDDQS